MRITIADFDFDNILSDEISYKNTSVYGISYKALTGAKPVSITFDTIK